MIKDNLIFRKVTLVHSPVLINRDSNLYQVGILVPTSEKHEVINQKFLEDGWDIPEGFTIKKILDGLFPNTEESISMIQNYLQTID